MDHRPDDAIMMEAPMRGSSNEREASREQRENRTDLNQEVARLQRYVTGVSRSCPELWKRVDEMRARPDWPTWCFLPTSEIGRLIGGMREVDPSVGAKLNSIAALAGWRVTQGVYRFDPDLFDSVWHTPLDTQIPGEVLFRLPEWCVYIMTPGCVFAERSLGGFFAYLDYDAGSGRTELRLLLDQGEDHLFSALPIDLGRRSLLDGLETSRDRFLGILTQAGKASELAEIIATDMRQYVGMLVSCP